MEPKVLTLSLHSRRMYSDFPARSGDGSSAVRLSRKPRSMEPERLGNQSRLDGRLASDLGMRGMRDYVQGGVNDLFCIVRCA